MPCFRAQRIACRTSAAPAARSTARGLTPSKRSLKGTCARAYAGLVRPITAPSTSRASSRSRGSPARIRAPATASPASTKLSEPRTNVRRSNAPCYGVARPSGAPRRRARRRRSAAGSQLNGSPASRCGASAGSSCSTAASRCSRIATGSRKLAAAASGAGSRGRRPSGRSSPPTTEMPHATPEAKSRPGRRRRASRESAGPGRPRSTRTRPRAPVRASPRVPALERVSPSLRRLGRRPFPRSPCSSSEV